MIFKFLHTPKPRGYSYQPVFYNPEEEKKATENKEPEDTRKLRREMESRWMANRRRNRASTIKVMVFVVVILVLLYFIFFLEW